VVADVTTTNQPTKSIVASSDGTPIAYWRSGHGDPLVVVHGGTSDHTRWNTLLPLLEPHVLVCTMDRRGRGESGDGPRYSIERERDDVVCVVDAVARDTGAKVDLFGHSYGALVSLEAALVTANLRRLVLYEPPSGVEPLAIPLEFIDRVEALVAAGHGEEAVLTFFGGIGMPDADMAALRAHPAWPVRVANAGTIVREARAVAAYQPHPDRLAAITAPTLLLTGSDSPPPLLAAAERLAGCIPSAEVVVLEGQGHDALDTSPALFVNEVVSFLGRTASQ
jgi:pimeloyl-ACP methyl ester carboxylesterase